jgi:WD40 repeat protein
MHNLWLCFVFIGFNSWSWAQTLSLETPIALPKPAENVEKLLYSPLGGYLGALVAGKVVVLYDAEGQLVRQYSAPDKTTWAELAFSPDETLLALAQVRRDSSFVRLYDLQNGNLLQEVFLFSAPLSVLAWHAQGEVLMCASEKREYQAWQWQSTELKRVHKVEWEKDEIDEVWHISATNNGRLWALAGIGEDIKIYEWKKQDLRLRQSLKVGEPVFGLAFHPIEPTLYISTAKNLKSYQYQKRTWLQTDSLPTLTPIANQLLMLKGNRGLVSVQEGKLVQYVPQESGLPTLHFIYQQEAIILAHTPNPMQTRWAVATADGKLQLFVIKE